MAHGSPPHCLIGNQQDVEKALLEQVMRLTPEQVNALPPAQREQVLQLQRKGRG